MRVRQRASKQAAVSSHNVEPRFEFWSIDSRRQFAVPGVITPDAEAVRNRLLEEMEWRISDSKKQFNSIPLLLGRALHRYYSSSSSIRPRLCERRCKRQLPCAS